MRTFIAIELPKQIKDVLADLQAHLKQSNADVKWVKPENIHLTLKFLGEIDEDKLVKITEIIERIASQKKQFQIKLSRLGAFPKKGFPRVLWVSVDKGDEETKAIVKELEENIERLGIPKEERPFSSHITIGRIRSPLNKDKLLKALNESEDYFAAESIEFDVTGITLFKSALGPGGPVYEALKEVNMIIA